MHFQVSPCPHLVQTGCCQLSSSSIPLLLPPLSHLLPPRHLAVTPITTGTSQPPDIPISTPKSLLPPSEVYLCCPKILTWIKPNFLRHGGKLELPLHIPSDIVSYTIRLPKQEQDGFGIPTECISMVLVCITTTQLQTQNLPKV